MQRFLQSPFNGAGIRITQYKDNYRPLADDIIRNVEGVEASVTTHRLRKLFYYTDPAICPADKLELPSFGNDFVQALFKYIEEELKPVATIPKPLQFPRKWLWRNAVLLLFLAVAIAILLWPDQPKFWEEHFEDVSVKALNSNGWQILDYDSVAFSRQIKPGCLTLYTYPGDYWVKWEHGEQPMIKNLPVKEIGTDHCAISVRLMNFNPYQNYQQVAVFLFGPDIDRKNHLRISANYSHSNQKEFQFIGKYTDRRQFVQILHMINGRPHEKDGGDLRVPEFHLKPFSEIGIVLEVREQTVTIGYWAGNYWVPVNVDNKSVVELPFVPKYVGIAAFQGFTDEYGQPLGADTIPAFFDYLKVEPLPE